MEQTVKLYDNDAYQTEFKAKVISYKKEENGYSLILDKTLFFPEEGGQSADKGLINGFIVTDVQITDGVITHFVKEHEISNETSNETSIDISNDVSSIQPGCEVSCSIDWNERFSNMQNHTGEHILSGIINKLYGYNNVGFHLSQQIVTMDMDGQLTDEQVKDIEKRANQAVYDNVEVIAEYPDKSVLKDMEYRSKIEIDGPVRIVTVKGYDVCACCAPHVKRTGEIGAIKIIRSDKYKGGVRLTILCGSRAIDYYDNILNQMGKAAQLLSANVDTLPDEITRKLDEISRLNSVISQLKMEVLKTKMADIPDSQENIVIYEEGLDNTTHRNYVNMLVERCEGICAVFNGNESEGYKYIIGSKSVDTRQVGNLLKEKLGARGGGKPEMIQGSLTASKEEINKVMENIIL